MSVDKLQEKIRRVKNPTVIDMSPDSRMIPPSILEGAASWADAYLQYIQELIEALHGSVPALRFQFNAFALLGAEGLRVLGVVTKRAQRQGYYVLLDAPEALSADRAEQNAQLLLGENAPASFDGLIVSSYIGSDGLKPYAKAIAKTGKSLFVVIRTPNKSASELQDLLTGSRLVHMAMADVVNHLETPTPGRCGYNQIGCAASATSADSLRTLRSKYKNMFLLVDGYGYSTANAKNCSYAFDSVGHGAIVCASSCVTMAWQEPDCPPQDYIRLAQEEVGRIKKNLSKYVTVL